MSPIEGLPNYRLAEESNAYPYIIAMTQPHAELEQTKTQIYGFRVQEKIPTLQIPLSGEDFIVIDFDEIYQQTYESLAYFSNRVDYSELPKNFETYQANDQQKIRELIQTIN